jgi:type II secretory pathway predicted ATPase ExeA
MYESHWGLRENPFRPSGHERFYFPSRGHEEAQARMLYALRGGRGLVLLTGRTGHGVTTALERFAASCDGRIVRAPAAGPAEAVEVLAGALDATAGGRPYDALVKTLERMASPVVLWDDAHVAAPSALEVARMLCDVRCAGETRLTAVLAGELALEDRVRATPALAGRVEISFRLPGLDEDEVRPYVEARLAAAGAQRPVFEDAAWATIGFHAGGNPRRIQALCDGALLVGSVEKASKVTREIVRRAAAEMERG